MLLISDSHTDTATHCTQGKQTHLPPLTSPLTTAIVGKRGILYLDSRNKPKLRNAKVQMEEGTQSWNVTFCS